MGNQTFYQTIIPSPIGNVKIICTEKHLEVLTFTEEAVDEVKPDNIVLIDAVTQLNAFYEGAKPVFNLPLKPQGTDFQQKVWRALQAIPFCKAENGKS